MTEDDLIEKYPRLFYNSLISFEIGEGWIPIVDAVLQKLSEYDYVRIIQIKEKIGFLTIYPNIYTDEVVDIIRDAERKSMQVCEKCGSRDKVVRKEIPGRSWLKTYCEKCRNSAMV